MSLFRRQRMPRRSEPLRPQIQLPLHERFVQDPSDQAVLEEMAEWGLIAGDFPRCFPDTEGHLAITGARFVSGPPVRLYLTTEAIVLDMQSTEDPLRIPLASLQAFGSTRVLETQAPDLYLVFPHDGRVATAHVKIEPSQQGENFSATFFATARRRLPALESAAFGPIAGWGDFNLDRPKDLGDYA